MATYEKIDSNNFREITQNSKIIKKQDLIRERERLLSAYQSLVQPTNEELRAFALANHPYYIQKNILLAQWQELKDLIDYLQSL